MKIEKLDRVVVYVDDLDAAKKLYSETLGISFDDLPREGIEPMKVESGPGAAPMRKPLTACTSPRSAGRSARRINSQ